MHARPRVVGHEVQRDDGLAVRLADQVEHAGQREIVHVVGGIVAVGPILTETGERAVHEPRIVLAERLVVGAESLRHPGAEAFDDDVDACRELPEERLPLGRFHVEGDGALVPVHVREGGAALAVGVLLRGRVDLEDLRAHVREHHSGHLRRGNTGQLQHLDAVEDSHSVLLLVPLTLPSSHPGEENDSSLSPRGRRTGEGSSG